MKKVLSIVTAIIILVSNPFFVLLVNAENDQITVPSTTIPIILDGVIGTDWSDGYVKDIVFYPTTNFEARGKFYIKYDKDNLYYAVSMNQEENIPPEQILGVDFDVNNSNKYDTGDVVTYSTRLSVNTFDYNAYWIDSTIRSISADPDKHVNVSYANKILTFEFILPLGESKIQPKQMGVAILFNEHFNTSIFDFCFDNKPLTISSTETYVTLNFAGNSSNIPGYSAEIVLAGLLASYILLRKKRSDTTLLDLSKSI